VLLDLLAQQPKRLREDRPCVTVGNLPPEQSLQALEVVVRLLADRELHPVAARREGLDDRAVCAG